MITEDTHRFIDISKWQMRQNLDWKKLPPEIEAVIIRATYGTTPDPRFAQHLESTVDAGRRVGAYHFVTYAEPGEQWKAFQDTVKAGLYGDAEDVLPVLDCEWLPGESKPKDPKAYVEVVDAMIWRCFERYGGVIIYTATGFWEQCGKPESWLDWPLWLAHYPKDRSEEGARQFAQKVYTPHGLGKWKIWQSGPRVIPGFDKRGSGIDYNYSLEPLPAIGETDGIPCRKERT